MYNNFWMKLQCTQSFWDKKWWVPEDYDNYNKEDAEKECLNSAADHNFPGPPTLMHHFRATSFDPAERNTHSIEKNRSNFIHLPQVFGQNQLKRKKYVGKHNGNMKNQTQLLRQFNLKEISLDFKMEANEKKNPANKTSNKSFSELKLRQR